MGVHNWQRLQDVMIQLVDSPDLVRKMMMVKGRFAAALTEKVLQDVDVDAAIFSEPIGGNEGPLISPRMYEDMVLKSYQPVLDVPFENYRYYRELLRSIIEKG
jgi:hypothetical protein